MGRMRRNNRQYNIVVHAISNVLASNVTVMPITDEKTIFSCCVAGAKQCVNQYILCSLLV